MFLKDNHAFHRFSSFVLLIAGVLCFICELLIPTTKEEFEKIEEIYGINVNKKNKYYVNDTAIFNSVNNNQSNNEEKFENNNIEKNEEKKVEIKESDLTSDEQNIKNSNNAQIISNNQSTNPYDLPEDF